MKRYTLTQKKVIIQKAIKILKEKNDGMCWAITEALHGKIDKYFFLPTDEIVKIFPRFQRDTAIEYFGANNNMESVWWYKGSHHGSKKALQHRVDFLRYLITGKLPKKKVKK